MKYLAVSNLNHLDSRFGAVHKVQSLRCPVVRHALHTLIVLHNNLEGRKRVMFIQFSKFFNWSIIIINTVLFPHIFNGIEQIHATGVKITN